jgi:AraC-like DNA-binding protein
MVQDKNLLQHLAGVAGLMGFVSDFKLARTDKITPKVVMFLAGIFFCFALWAADFGLSKAFHGYPSGTILYGCLFILFLFAASGHEKQEQKQENAATTPEVKVETAEKSPVQRAGLTIEQSLKFRQMLKEHFSTTLAFRKHGYTIRDLSNETGIPVYLLSAYINQEYGMNFNEMVNAYRVEYMAKVFKTSGDWKSYTLEALGKMAGFNSRAAFIAAIKKHTGMNPSAFFGRKDNETITHTSFNFSGMLKDVA